MLSVSAVTVMATCSTGTDGLLDGWNAPSPLPTDPCLGPPGLARPVRRWVRWSAVNASVSFGADLESTTAARRFAERTMADWSVDGERFETARLLVSELVANAVTHAETDVTLQLDLSPERLRVEVRDGADGRAASPPAPPRRPDRSRPDDRGGPGRPLGRRADPSRQDRVVRARLVTIARTRPGPKPVLGRCGDDSL